MQGRDGHVGPAGGEARAGGPKLPIGAMARLTGRKEDRRGMRHRGCRQMKKMRTVLWALAVLVGLVAVASWLVILRVLQNVDSRARDYARIDAPQSGRPCDGGRWTQSMRRDEPMEIATQAQLAKLRDLLNARMGELRAEIQAADSAAVEADRAAPGLEDVRDTKDAAAQVADIDVLAAQRQRDADELSLVRAALQRLQDGTYGDCADCGDSIPLARLWAQPAATRCARCQARAEQSHAAG
jgi:RNA polymerase-binding protein DksA